MGIKNWAAEMWADAKYKPPIIPEIRRELNWRQSAGLMWVFAGFFLIGISELFGGVVVGIALWDILWTGRIATLNMSPKWVKRETDKRWKRPKVKQ